MDPPGVAPVAGGAGLEVEVEGGGAGDQGVLRCLHREHVQDLVTEPDIDISIGAALHTDTDSPPGPRLLRVATVLACHGDQEVVVGALA